MAAGYNKVLIMGNLARDPEIRYTNDKKPVGNFTVAVNKVWKDRDGEKQESVDFIPVVVWGVLADNCEKYLSKGSPVFVEGRIQVRSYEAKDGSKRYVTEIVASEVRFLGSKNSRSHNEDDGFEDRDEKPGRKKNSDGDKPQRTRKSREAENSDDNEPFDMSSARADDDDGENPIPF